ncbi:diaminopropionate ammonia-lyase [Neisseriaceae bacterium CLB008]|nr:diaminopropionate ammonia-lyase [Neisseriaceae bacterium]
MHTGFHYVANGRKKSFGEGADLSALSAIVGQRVLAFHQKLPIYAPTPLRSLPALSAHLGLGSLHVKDESQRFGLNAFKGLGGSYAVAKYLGQQLGLTEEALSFDVLMQSENRARLGEMTFVTATDGNHGRGVAWAAQQLGHRAIVYMPKGASPIRAENIRQHGAECQITELNYDDTVRFASEQAERHQWALVQDTAWPGYEAIPEWIMQGYMTLVVEALAQLRASQAPLPTHVVLQAGVGSFAGAIMGHLVATLGAAAPKVWVVEPNKANCLYQSAVHNDGHPHAVKGDLDTLMAGLACGEPNTQSWPIVRDHTDYFFSVADAVAANGMRILAAPLAGDPAIVSGESGAVGMGLVHELKHDPQHQDLCARLGLQADAHVLLISTEGDTSPDVYQDIVWRGRQD